MDNVHLPRHSRNGKNGRVLELWATDDLLNRLIRFEIDSGCC